MLTFKMFEEMIDGLREMSKLIGESRGAIELAKTVNKDVAKIWLARAVTDICEAQNMPVEYFFDFVKGDFVEMYSFVKDDLSKMHPDTKEKIIKQSHKLVNKSEKTNEEDRPSMDIFGFTSQIF